MSKKKTAVPALAPPTIAKGNPLLDRFEKQWYWHYALLFVLPFFVFIKTASFEFIDFDDVAIIVNNGHILSSIKKIGLAFKTDAFLSLHGDFYRPMQTVSYFFDAFVYNIINILQHLKSSNPIQELALDDSAKWSSVFHITNLIYHILTAMSIYVLLRQLKRTNTTALFAALIFSVHPLLASAISWVPSRGDILFTLFGLQMLICFIRYYNTGKIGWLLLSFLAFALSLFSKETAVLLPLLPLCYVFFLQQGKRDIQKFLFFLGLSIMPIVLFYWLRSKVVIASPPDFILGIKPFVSNLPAVPIFLLKFIVPYKLSTMPLFDSAATGLGFLLLAIALWFTIKAIIKKQWLPVFGFAWFVLFILPPLVFKLYYSKYLLEYYEHRSYMPVIGLMIVLAFVWDKVSRYSRAYVYAPIGVVLVFTFVASIHSDHFKNSIVFFGSAAEQKNPGAATKRGELFLAQRDVNSAMEDFNSAIDFSDGNYPPAFFNRGNIYTNQIKDYRKAEEDYSKALMLDTSYIGAYINRANARILASNFPAAMADLEKAEQLDKYNTQIYYTRAKAFTSANKFTEADAMFGKAISMDSGMAEMFNDRAYVRYRLQNWNGALEDCNKAIQLFPQFLNAYYNKGMIYYETGRAKEAIPVFDTTLALANNFYFGYFYRGMAKKSINDTKGACEDWRQSVQLGFKQAEDTIRTYCK